MVNCLYKKYRMEHEFVIILNIFQIISNYFQKKEGLLNIYVVYIYLV